MNSEIFDELALSAPEVDWAEIEYKKGSTTHPVYYCHVESKETTFDIPQEYKEWRDSLTDIYLKNSGSSWRRYDDKSSKTSYYSDKITKASQWEAPEIVLELHNALGKLSWQRWKKRKQSRRLDSGEAVRGEVEASADRDVVDTKEVASPVPGREAITPSDEAPHNLDEQLQDHKDPYPIEFAAPKIEDDVEEPKAKIGRMTHEDIETFLRTKDAVMNENAFNIFQRAVSLREEGVEVEAVEQSFATSLSSSYVGLAHLSHIVAYWHHLVNSMNGSDGASAGLLPNKMDAHAKSTGDLMQTKDSTYTTESVENILQNALDRVLSQHFSASVADRIVSGATSPAWLGQLIANKFWRQSLIRLFEDHKHSKLLGYCIRFISSRGHSKSDSFYFFHSFSFFVISYRICCV